MTHKKITKIVTEGAYAAEVDVELLYDETGWSPYLSLKDANKLDDVRLALRNRDMKTATRLARIFELVPITV